MAGRARLQALKDELTKQARAYFDVDATDIAIGTNPEPSHLEYVCAQVESGTSTTKVATQLGNALGFDVSYERLMAYLRSEYGREAVDSELRQARSRASHCIAEQAVDLVDAPASDSVSVQRARNRASQRNWLAEKYNKSDYGQQKDVNVAISITSLHLDALRSRPNGVTGSVQQPSITAGGVQDAQVEVIEQ